MGLGSIQEVSLTEARDSAHQARALVRKGEDPIKDRKRRKRQADRETNTPEQVIYDAFESRKSSLKGDGKSGQWINPLVNHVIPKLGQIPVAEIVQNDIRYTLAPIWHEKSAVAKKAMDRLGICLRHATALGLDVDLQAVDKAKALLGKSRHVVRHVPAMAWKDLPEFYASLNLGTPTSLAMRFLILTATRSGEVRNLILDEIHDDVWVIPAERMKAGKEHRVPLSSAAQTILEEAKQFERHGHVFVGNLEKPISDMTLSAVLKRRGLEARPHGFRTSFRTWCAEETDTPREIAETALAHISGGTVELAYRRTDYLDRRRELMVQWAEYVTSAQSNLVRHV
jgi:integrase